MVGQFLEFTSHFVGYLCLWRHWCFWGLGGLFHKLATSFPHLKKLYLDEVRRDDVNIEALATLQDLEILYLRGKGWLAGAAWFQGIRQLTDCKKLQKLDVSAHVSGDTLVHLLQSCPNLGHIIIGKITEVAPANPQEAAAILESLAGIAKRDIIIQFRTPTENVAKFLSIWCVEPVFGVIGKLKENNGWEIKVTWDTLKYWDTFDIDSPREYYLGITASLCATPDLAAARKRKEKEIEKSGINKVETIKDK